MEPQFTLSISGATDGLAPLLRRMADALDGAPSSVVPLSGPGPTAWWSVHADDFVRQIQPNARRALGIVAKHAPEVPFDTVQQEMGAELGLGKPLGGIPLSGMLASVGFAKRRMKAPDPFTRDYGKRVYLMDPAVATLLTSSLAKHRST